MNVLDVRIDNLSRDEIFKKIESFLLDGKFHQVCTINAEIILKAQEDKGFKNILNKSDLNVADSVSIRYAFLRFGKRLKCRFAGVDLMHEILSMANEKRLSVFLAASKNGLSSYEEIRDSLIKFYPDVNFSGNNIDPNKFASYQISNAECDILFCAFGAPHQEMFINFLKDDIIGVAMGVGGSFDFATGKIKRAPKIMRYFGLEWLWRLMLEPKYRLKRALKAVLVFPIRIIFSKNNG